MENLDTKMLLRAPCRADAHSFNTPTEDQVDHRISRFNLTRQQLDEGFLRLSGIVAPMGLLPISRSTWLCWVADGKVAVGIKLSRGVTVWPRAYIHGLVAELAAMGGPNG